jgi:LPXTG-site transpeptidase (sortase) family protein
VSPRWLLLVSALAALLVAGLAGGLTYWNGRGDDDAAVVIVPAAGPDVPPAADAGDGARAGGEVPQLNDDFRRAVEEALREEQEAEEQRQAADAYARARAEGETIANDAIRRWGRGQLLLAMPSIGVTASVQQMGYERDGRTPATPNTPWGVGWYTFTDYPGTPGNAVFSGHVDWYTGAPAVFGGLRNVKLGDIIYMVLTDGTPIAYQVQRSEWVTPYTANVGEIFGITAHEAITFITCGGAWDPVAKDYSHRLIVRAFRVW